VEVAGDGGEDAQVVDVHHGNLSRPRGGPHDPPSVYTPAMSEPVRLTSLSHGAG